MSTTTDGTGTLGPGELKIGPTGALLTVSCLVNNARIVPDVSEGDSKTMLCGTQKSAADTITWALSGNMDTDGGYGDGFLAYTWLHAGEVVDFEFTPSTAVGTKVAGQLKLRPLEFGADEYGGYLDSDFEFALDNFDPASMVTWGAATGSPAAAGTVAITGVTAGNPATLQPSNATRPYNLTALKADSVIGDSGSNKPTTAWTTGQRLVLGDASLAHWTGTAWAAGAA